MAEVMELLKKMDKSGYRLITFENDVPALYLTFSMFAHVPISKYAEAFGQIYIESLACRIPVQHLKV